MRIYSAAIRGLVSLRGPGPAASFRSGLRGKWILGQLGYGMAEPHPVFAPLRKAAMKGSNRFGSSSERRTRP